MFLDATDLCREQAWLRLSNAELATRAGISVGRLSKLKAGNIRIQSDDRRRLSRALADRLSELRKENERDDATAAEPDAAREFAAA